ncbi:TonB-dependent receptor [Lysobacter arvi]|uniref:TonB-dependent receptor n=1 Tax=Lysobacter arvi TaxID=3038776 RepID=A0ABU1CCJ1_9GAMM|nr:TonB-dependent receptor [Lysobacter arvi]MDR0182845.1 TonB-dependent receptor [Lysobacter arvi]
MSPRKSRLAVGLGRALFGCFAIAASPLAFAQAASTTTDATQLDTITVTAQSREQELLDVPIALQVVTEQLIDDVAAEDLGDIDSFVPGLRVNSLQPTQPSFQLRGIETDDFGIGTDPAVGVYVDGVYAGRGGGVLLPFTDVQRIEVLKGPQGTLFGRNTAAGAISIITHRPDTDGNHARGKLRLGNDNKTYFEGMANVAVSDTSALRFNGIFNHSDGWVRDAATGEDLAPEDNWATRAAFQTRFGDNTRAWISWDHESLDQRGQATTGVVPIPALPGLPAAPADPSSFLDPERQPYLTDAPDAETRTFDGVTLIVDHNFGGFGMTSTSAWHDYDSLNRVEEDGTNLSYLYVDSTNTESNTNFYQEFKFNGSTDRIDWVAGVSYFQEEADQTSEVNALTDSVDTIANNLGLAPGGLYGPLTMAANMFGIPVDLTGLPWNEKFVNSLDTKAYAAFGDVIWRVNDRTNLTFGLRYTRDEKDFTWFNDLRSAPQLDAQLALLDQIGFLDAAGIPLEMLVFDIAFIDPPALANKGVLNRAKKSWDDWSPRFVVDYHFNDDLMGFASLAKGYKAGGFNALQIGSEFENEDVWNFETGIKHALPDYRLAYNVSAFYYVYDNRQAVTLDMTTEIPRFLVNTSDQEAYGVDFDLRWQATDGLGFDFNAEYLDSTFKTYVNPQGLDLGGQPTGAPEWSFAAGANYVWRLADAGNVRASARYSYVGECRSNDESVSVLGCGRFGQAEAGEAQEILDARIGWTSATGHWGIAVYGNNLLDNQYVNSFGTYGMTVLGTVGARMTPPRTYGVELTANF